jgi:hypothetical protein
VGLTRVCKLGRERWIFKKTLQGNLLGKLGPGMAFDRDEMMT